MRDAGRVSPAVCALMAAMLGGCAHTWIDADGKRHIAGIMHLTLPAETTGAKSADWMRWRTIGVAISSTDIGNALEIGYSDNTLAVVRNNSCVAFDRLPATLFSSSGDLHAPAPLPR